MNQRKIDILTCKNAKIVGCEFSKYIQIKEGRQKKIRRYREEDIKPLLPTISETEERLFTEAEYLLNNSQYNWMKLVQVENEDKWQIIDKRYNKARFKDTPEKVYQTIKEIIKNQ